MFVMSLPPSRVKALDTAERLQLQTAYTAWTTNTAYIDNGGNIRLKTGGGIAPWNKLVKSLFLDQCDFHRAAHQWNAGVFVDPTQCPRFVSYGLQGRTEVRLARGETFGPAVATTNTVPAADLIAQALYEYMKTPHGREKVEELIRTTGLV